MRAACWWLGRRLGCQGRGFRRRESARGRAGGVVPGGAACCGGAGRAGRLGRPGGELGEAGAAPFAGAGRQPGGGAAGVVVLAGVVGGEDALVADCQQAGDPECERGQAREAAPAAGDAGGGGVLDGGVDALGGGAPPVGPPPLRRRVVVFWRVLAATSGGTVMVCWVQQ